MKTRTIVSVLILVLAVLVIVGSCASTKKAVSDEDVVEMFTGTWINTDNPSGPTWDGLPADPQKFILTANQRHEWYYSVDDMLMYGSGPYTIIDSWVDRKGNTYCHAKYVYDTGSRVYALWKLDESKIVFEQTYYYGGKEMYPTKIVTHDVITVDDHQVSEASMYYNIFYRQ